MKKIVPFQPLSAALYNAAPDMGMVYHPNQASLFSGLSNQLHFGFHALLQFHDMHGRLPGLHDKNDAALVTEIAKKLLIEAKSMSAALTVDSIDESVISKLSYFSKTEVPGIFFTY